MKTILLTALMLGMAGGAYAGTTLEQLGGVTGAKTANTPVLSAPAPVPAAAENRNGEVIMKYTSELYGHVNVDNELGQKQAAEAMRTCVAALEKAGITIIEARILPKTLRNFEVSFLANPREVSIEKYSGVFPGDYSTTHEQEMALASAQMTKYLAALWEARIPVLEARLAENKPVFTVVYLGSPSYKAVAGKN